MKKQLSLLGMSLFLTQTAMAMAVDWSGTYRFEYTEIDKTNLSAGGGRKSYLLSHLNLSPKIIAADGVHVVANFEVLGNANYPNSQVGQQFGSGANAGTATNMNGTSSNVTSQNQGSSNLQVRELYATFNQEYGSILVGRAPLQFGLGMSYNAGKGAFDHWGDIQDLVGYKFLIGNLSIMPMIGKPYDYSPAQGREVTDTMFDIQYNNAETESVFGLFYRTRTSSQSSNDAYNVFDSGVNPAYTSVLAASGWSTNHTNITLMRGWDSFKFRMEAGFDSGSTGIKTAGGQEIKINGYGIALELDFPKTDWKWLVKTGLVSGDNPTTDNFEGYQMDRNYDVAFMMFNHPMGGYDVLTSRVQRNRDASCTTVPCPTYANEEALDEEAISNTVYFSPRFTISFGDKLDWRNTLTYAQVQTNPSRVLNSDTSKDLGFEWDTALVYRPYERVQWVNEIGLFSPGSAFKEGSVGRDAGFTYGFQSKAAISF
ncbi:MAG: hypothetical protein ACK5P7_10730 [Bdellovibrio sp.]